MQVNRLKDQFALLPLRTKTQSPNPNHAEAKTISSGNANQLLKFIVDNRASDLYFAQASVENGGMFVNEYHGRAKNLGLFKDTGLLKIETVGGKKLGLNISQGQIRISTKSAKASPVETNRLLALSRKSEEDRFLAFKTRAKSLEKIKSSNHIQLAAFLAAHRHEKAFYVSQAKAFATKVRLEPHSIRTLKDTGELDLLLPDGEPYTLAIEDGPIKISIPVKKNLD